MYNACGQTLHQPTQQTCNVHTLVYSKDAGVHTPIYWYDHKPTSTVNANDVTIMWNMSIPTSIHIPNNEPDILIYDCEKRICILIDISVPQDQNITKKYPKKYKNTNHLNWNVHIEIFIKLYIFFVINILFICLNIFINDTI